MMNVCSAKEGRGVGVGERDGGELTVVLICEYVLHLSL